MATAISAPGKVLLAGGYLVLDRAYTGYVFGLSARIHVVVKDKDSESGIAGPETENEIVVTSPQFLEAEWRYRYAVLEGGRGVEVKQIENPSSSRNPFVETSLIYALTYIHTLSPTSLHPAQITILADNDYYSHSSPSPTSSSSFRDFAVRLSDAHKTGLGSSAALVTSLTGALLSHYLPPDLFSLTTDVGRTTLHNLAQTSHCAAQGKVGSGFDVAAAVYGTCIYRRFSPSLLSGLGDANAEGFSGKLKDLVEDTGSEKKWDTEVKKEGINIPTGYALVMCDVDCGSQTVGMVKKVLSWRAVDSGSATLWAELQAANDALAASLAGGDANVIAGKIHAVRALIREMGTKSGVPIEPGSQTELLDALTGLEGVVGGVVPGAGGFDAVVLLIKDDGETTAGIETFLKDWSQKKQENVKLLSVKGEMEGVRRENRDYREWLK